MRGKPPPIATSKAAPLLPLRPPREPSVPGRPSVKLRVGNQHETPKASASKPKHRKLKSVDAPPPPYVDDGSHDLLQEVIAIEQEKSASRYRPGADKDNIVNDKRKVLLDDDEIIALASPAKDRSLPANTVPAVAVGAPASPILSASQNKAAQPSGSLPPLETSRITLSLKGKEKELMPPPATVPVKPKGPVLLRPITINEKKCKEVLRTLLKLPEAAIFARPVDPERDGCPT
jgi:transcription initiation factor TFIID subunit 2